MSTERSDKIHDQVVEEARARAPEAPPDDAPGMELDLTPHSLADQRQLGWWLSLAESPEDSERTRGAAGAWRVAIAADLGLKIVAAAELSLIKGRLQVSARLLRALANREGYTIQKVDESEETCTAVISGPDGRELGRQTFTLEMAQRAGIVKPKGAWETHPGRMCWARASSWVIYDHAPMVALGMLTEEEAGDFVDLPPGDVVEVPEETEEQATARLFARMGAVIDELNEGGEKTPVPEGGGADWDAYAKKVTKEEFGFNTRSLLNAKQIEILIRRLLDDSVPFS